MKTSIKLACVFLITLVLASCSGDQGPVGPAGPEGPTGPAGPEGPVGEDGNANVTIVSLLVSDINWASSSFLGRAANQFTLTTSAVNQDIIDSGVVLGYTMAFGSWYPLPFTWENSAGTSRQYILFMYSLETIDLYAYQTSGVLNPSAMTEYRFVLITDNTVTSGKRSTGGSILDRLQKAGIDPGDYFAVIDYFGIREPGQQAF